MHVNLHQYTYTMWWDSEKIEATVTRTFVCSHLLPEEIERLDRPLGFGDGLTDGTYWEWIEERAKRVFLILVDLGVPDQIFGVIDDSWDDEDLPIARDQIERLALTPGKDEKAERRFYYRQFYYLLKPLQKGEHTVFQDIEVIPLDVVERKQALAHSQFVDKVTLPNHPGKVLCRRKIPLGSGPGCLSYEDFLYEINSIRNLQNNHLVSYFASYVYQGYGYVLFTPVCDCNMKTFLTTTPTTFKNLDKQIRRQHILNWVHCLVDTLAFLHNRGLSHGNIKPSTVLFNNENHIFLSDFSRLNAELLAGMADRTSFDKESYDYAAPEQWFRPSSSPTNLMTRKATLTTLSTSPNNTTFSISRSGSEYSNSPVAMMHAPTPQLSPQAADIFSLGCVILELLSLLMKKTTRNFATHRAAKHKTPGRGGAVLDSSFHKNLGQVESWMTQLAREAKKKDEPIFRGITPMLHIVERMLALHPHERPAARDVQTRMYEILHDTCGIHEPHCVHQYGNFDSGVRSLEVKPVKTDAVETMSMATKRSSAVPSLLHRRTNSGGSGWGTLSRTNSSAGSVQEPACPREREPLSPRLRQSEIGSGLQAIQALRVRNNGSGWQYNHQNAAPVSVGY